MHKIDSPGNNAGQWTNGNPNLGVEATLIDEVWMNAVQGEFENTIVEGAGAPLDKLSFKQLLFAIGALSAANATPQTVLNGSVDANGYANFLATSANLNLPISATTTPLLIAFGCGWGNFGPINRVGRIIADTVLALAASVTSYVYAERDPVTYAITLNKTTLRPVYGFAHPGAPAAGQCSFLIPFNQMYEWSGAAWVAKQRVFLGEAVTSGAAVTAVVTYALRGRTILTSAAALAVNQTAALAHKLGMRPGRLRATLINLTTELNFAVGDEIWEWPNFFDATNVRFLQIAADATNVITMTDAAALMIEDKTVAGSNVALTMANWGVKFYVDRGW